MGREADSGVLSGASCPPPPCREDELKSEGLRVHLLVFPWPQPEARGEKKGPASGLGIVSPRGTFIWQLLPHPHPEYLEVSPCPALLPSRAQMGSGFYLGILTTAFKPSLIRAPLVPPSPIQGPRKLLGRGVFLERRCGWVDPQPNSRHQHTPSSRFRFTRHLVFPPHLPFLVVPVSCFHLQGSPTEDLTGNPLASPRLLTALSALGGPRVTWPLSVIVWLDLRFREVKHGPEATQPD